MSPFRPAVVAAAVTCACSLTACGSGDNSEKPAPSASARSTAAAAVSPTAAASSACPSRAEIADAISAADHSTGVIVSAEIVCQDGWATAAIRYSGADPARAIVRRRNGKVRLVTYGTDGLCGNPQMKTAPAEIKKALGPYC